MAKTNYSKVEGAFDEGLRKLLVDKLLEMTDKIEAGPAQNEAGFGLEVESSEVQREKELRIQTLLSLMRELKNVHKYDKKVYKRVTVSPKKLRAFIDNPHALSPQEWEEIKRIKKEVAQYHKELLQKLPHKTDEEIIESEREAHVSKRHKVNPQWLPMHRINP